MKSLLLLLTGFISLNLQGVVLSREDVIYTALPYAFHSWTVNTINTRYTIYSIPGLNIHGEAYSYGNKHTPSEFDAEIATGKIPRNWMGAPGIPANPQEDYTGIDCSGFVSRSLKADELVDWIGSATWPTYTVPVIGQPKEGDVWCGSGHVFLEGEFGYKLEANPRDDPIGGNRVQFLSRGTGGFTARSIFPQFRNIYPSDKQVFDNIDMIDISLRINVSGSIYPSGVRMFITRNGEGEELVGETTLADEGDNTWEFKKEDFDVSEGGEYTVRVIARNDVTIAIGPGIVNNGYRDEYTWSFIVNQDSTPPMVVTTNPPNSSKDIPIDKSPITITFSEPMDPVTTTPAVEVPFSCSENWSSETVLEIRPEDILDYCSEYTITVTDAATDTSGVHLDGNKDGEAGGNYEFTFTTEKPPIDITIDPSFEHFELKNPGDCQSEKGSITIDGSKLLKQISCNLSKTIDGDSAWFSFTYKKGPFTIPVGEKRTIPLTVTACNGGGIKVVVDATFAGKVCDKDCGAYSASVEKQEDHPDENQSPGLSSYPTPIALEGDTLGNPEKVGVFIYGWTIGYAHILGKYKIPIVPVFSDFTYWQNPDTLLSDVVPLVVIGSGAFSGFNSSEFKQKLEEYVVNGGNLLVFTQKYGDDLSVLPGNIKGYGWNEDQSCFTKAVYLCQWHPVFAGQTKQAMDCNSDGYLTEHPANAEILLSRTKNAMPALLYYSYGAGTVIVSSLYTDWGYGHNQYSGMELNLIRDLTTWALYPEIDIPEFYPKPSISVPVAIKYTVDDTTTAETAIIKVYTPDRKLYDSLSIPISLHSGEETQWQWNKLSYLSDIGLWVIDYALQDGSGKWIQGYNRGAIFAQKMKVSVGNYALGDFQLWVTSDKEEVLNGDTVNFEIFIKNTTDSVFTGKLIVALGHKAVAIDSFLNITLPPDSTINMNYMRVISATSNWRFGLYESDQYDYAADLINAIAFNNRGVLVIEEPFSISLSRYKESWYRYVLGIDSLHYKVEVANKISDSCSPYLSVYALMDSVKYYLWGDTLDIAVGGKKELEGVFFPLDFDTTVGKQQLCCELFFRDSLWISKRNIFELTYPSVQCSLALPDSFNYGDSNLYTVTLTTEGSCLPLGKLLLSGVNYSDSLTIDYSYDSDTTLVFDYQPDVWKIYESAWLDRLKLQYKYGKQTVEKAKNLNFRYPAISAFRPVYTKPQGGFTPRDTAVFKAQLYLKGSLYGVPLEFSLWSDYLGADTLRDTITLNPTSNRAITLKTYTDLDIPADTMISYSYRMRYLDKEYLPKGELQYFVQSPEAILHWPLGDTFSIGNTIPITFTNSIKSPSRVNIEEVYLYSGYDVDDVSEVFVCPGEVEVPGEGSYIFNVTVPEWKTGKYYLGIRSEIVEGRGVNLDLYPYGCPIYIDGIEANIEVSTSKDYYGYGEDIPFSSLLENGKYGWEGTESLKVARVSDSIGEFSIWDVTEYIDTFGLIPDGNGGLVLDSVYSLRCLYGEAVYPYVSNRLAKLSGYSGSSYSIAFDEWNNLWYSENDAGIIEKIEFPSLKLLEKFWFPDSIVNIKGIVPYQEIVYLIASDNGRVYKLNSTSGEIMGYIEPPNRRFLDLRGVALKENGNVLAVEDGTKILWEFSSSGDSISTFPLPSELYYGDMEYQDGKIYISTPYKIVTIEGISIDSFGIPPDSGYCYYGPIAIDDNGKVAVAGYRLLPGGGRPVDNFKTFENGSGNGFLVLFSSTGDIEVEAYWFPSFYDLDFYKKDIISFEQMGSAGNLGVYKEFGKENGLIRVSYWNQFEKLPSKYRFLSYRGSDEENSGSIFYWRMALTAYPGEEGLLPLESLYGTDYLLPIFITVEGNWQDSPVFYDCSLKLKVLDVLDSLIIENNYPLNLSPLEIISFADTIKDTIPPADYCVLGDACYTEYPQPVSSDWKFFTVIGNNLTLLLNSDREEGFMGDTFRINPLTINPLPLEEDSLRLLVKGCYNEVETTYVDTSFVLSAESADSFPFVITPEGPLVIRAELILPSFDTLRREFTPVVKSTRLLFVQVIAPDITDLSPFSVTSEVYNYSFDNLSVEVKRSFLSDTLSDIVNIESGGFCTFVDSFSTTRSDTLKVIAATGGEVFTRKKFIDLGIKGIVLLDSLYNVSPDSVMMSGIIRNEGLYPLEGNALFCMVETGLPAHGLQLTLSGLTADSRQLMAESQTTQQLNDLTADLSAQQIAISSVARVGKDLTLSAFLSQLVRAGIDTSFSAFYLAPGKTDTIPIAFNKHPAGGYLLRGFLFAEPPSFLLDSTSSAVNIVGNNQVFADSLIISENCDSTGTVPLYVVLNNSSYCPFSGNLLISSNICYFDSVIDLPSSTHDTVILMLTDPIDEGVYAFTAVITEGGVPVSEKIQNLEFHPVYRFDSLPVGLEVVTPDSGVMEISVTNIGNARGERRIAVNLADVININEDAIIPPSFSDTFAANFLIPEDFPGGEYFADVSILKNLYPEVDTFFNVKVNGLVIRARDSLDKLVYSVNDTTLLSIIVENQSFWSGDLLASLQYGQLELDTSFVLGGMVKGILNTTPNRDTLYFDASGVYMSDPISSDSYDSVSINWDISSADSISVQIRTDSVIGRGNWTSIEEDTVYPVSEWTQLKIENKSLTNQWINSLVLNFKPSGSLELDSFPVQEEIITLDVPVDSSEVKLGWGIYYPSGRSIVLDERYVYLSDSVLTIFTDKGRYEISDTVHTTLVKNFPDTNYTLYYRVYFSPTEEKRDSFELKDDTTRFSFVVPEWTRSGTYSIDYWVNETGLPAHGLQLTAGFSSELTVAQFTNLPINQSTDSRRDSPPLAKQWVLGKPTLSAFGDSAFISGEHLFDVDGITVYFKNARMDTNLYYEGETAKIRTEISSDIDLTANLNISSTGSSVMDINLDLKKDIPNKFEFDYLIEDCERGMNELYLHLAKDSIISLAGYVLYFDVYVGDTLAPLISILSEPSNTYSSNRFYELIARIYDPDVSGTPFTDTLYYRIASSGGSYWQSLSAHSVKGDTNKYLIPSQPNGTHIQYHLIARDEFGNLGRYPEEGESDFWVLSPLKPTWDQLTYSAAPSVILQWNSPEELVYYHSGLYSDTINISQTEIATRFTSQYMPAKLEKIGLDVINESAGSDTLKVSIYPVEANLLPGAKTDSFVFTDTLAGYEEFCLSNVRIPEEGIFVGVKGSSNLNAVLDGFGEGTHTIMKSGISWEFLTPGELLIDGLVSHTPSAELRGPSDIFSFDVFRSIDLSNWTGIASGLTGTSYADTAIQENMEYSYKVMVCFGNPVDSFFSVSRTIFVDFTPPMLDTITVSKSGESNLIVKAVLKDTSGIAWDSLGYRNNDTVNVIAEDSSENNEHFFSINFTGDTLFYYLKAQDLSLIENTKRYPEAGFYKWVNLSGIAEAIPDSTYLFRISSLLVERNIEIKYPISEKSDIDIMLFDITGRKVRTLVRENQNAGYYSVPMRASELPYGVYFLRMQAGDYKKTVKLVKVR